MSVAIFYPCSPYSEITKDILQNDIEKIYPVLNYPPQYANIGKHEEFLRLLKNPSIETLMVWMGGRIINNEDVSNSSYEMVEQLTDNDWIEIAKTRKNIVGSSDATYLLCALLSHGINCFYGPNYHTTLRCSSIEENRITLKSLSQALNMTTDYTIDFKDKNLTQCQYNPWIIRQGIATGRLIGGNLDTIIDLLENQSRWDLFPIRKGDILFLEEVDPLYHQDKKEIKGKMFGNLQYLDNTGVFSKVGGVVFGRSKHPKVFDEEKEWYYEEVENKNEEKYLRQCIDSAISNKNIPIIANIACGHTHPMLTFPLGKNATLNVYEQKMTVHY